MMKATPKLLCVTALAVVAMFAHAQVTEIKVSYQPALYWALPFYVADQQGWWAELGLKPTFSTFPAGGPQIAASASKSWDLGGTGSAPRLLPGPRGSPRRRRTPGLSAAPARYPPCLALPVSTCSPSG